MDPQSAAMHRLKPSRAGGPMTILIVEDSPVQAELLRRALELAGYAVLAAGDGVEGLALAKAHKPGAVVSDINMPIMDGYAMCRAIRGDAELRDTPVILLTMLSDTQDIVRGLNAGADAYLTKPYNIPTLLSRIELLLAHPPPPPPPLERRKVEVRLQGQTYLVDAHGPRLLNMLISTYENAVLQNRELATTQRALEDLNANLEQKVAEKTAALRVSEARFRSLAEMSSDFYWESDVEHRLSAREAAVARRSTVAGFDRGAQIGKRRWEIQHISPDEAGWQAHRATLDAHLPFRNFEISRLGIDDREHYLSISGDPVFDAAGEFEGYRGVGTDITERKTAETKIRRLSQLYAALSQCNEAIVRCASEEAMLREVCRAAVEFGGIRTAWVGMIDTATPQIRLAASFGASAADLDEFAISVDASSPQGGGPAGIVVNEDRPYWCQDWLNDPLTAPWLEYAKRSGWAASAYLPLHRNGVVAGVFFLYSGVSGAFDEAARALLVEMATDISFALDNFDREARRKQAEEALRESEIRFRALIEHASDLVIVLDASSGITYISPSIRQLGGYEPENLLGRNYLEFTHPEDAPASAASYADLLRNPGILQKTEFRFRAKDGTFKVLESTARCALDDPAISGIVINAHDVTERKLAETALVRVNRALRTLSAGNAALVHAGDELKLVEQMCRVLVETGGYRLAWVGYAENDERRTVRPIAHHIQGNEYVERDVVTWTNDASGRGPSGTAIRTMRPYILKDARTDPAYAPWRDNAIRLGYAAVASFPLLDQEESVIGVLCVYSTEIDGFLQEEIPLLAELAGDLAFGIRSQRARAAHEESVRRLNRSMEATIQAMAATLEIRDAYTAGHQRRVAELVTAIAGALKLPAEEIHALSLAAIVHDLGKIQVPAEILSKPGRLLPLEFELIKGHADAGFNILKDVDFPWPIAEIVRQHHERVDGSGYPRGLKGEDMLLGAKILGVADTVEAMTSHRPYRAGLGVDKALAEIEQASGRLYDPAVVDACVRLFREEGFVFSA